MGLVTARVYHLYDYIGKAISRFCMNLKICCSLQSTDRMKINTLNICILLVIVYSVNEPVRTIPDSGICSLS